jgi:signal peptidase I
VAVLIKTFLFQPFYIPSESMLPTIQVNDRVMVSKLSYRFGDPQRGDIVVFLSPFSITDGEESIPETVVRTVFEALGIRAASTEDFIKRVVAVGGDTVAIDGGKVVVNGEAIDEPYLPDGVEMADRPPEEVPEGYVFVMGDNRNQSYDSRRFGPVALDDLVGKAVFRIWPLARVGPIDEAPPESASAPSEVASAGR